MVLKNLIKPLLWPLLSKTSNKYIVIPWKPLIKGSFSGPPPEGNIVCLTTLKCFSAALMSYSLKIKFHYS